MGKMFFMKKCIERGIKHAFNAQYVFYLHSTSVDIQKKESETLSELTFFKTF